MSSAAPLPSRHAGRRPGRRPRGLLRWLRRLLLAVVGLLVLLLVACVVYNAVTTPPATFAAPDGQDVTVDGVRVHYRQWGTSGPQIVLVHGFAESTVSWEPMAERLGRDHRVIAVDLAGYGYTQYSGRYTLADQTELVAGLVGALKLDRPVLVGHSLGAAVVGSVALAHPQLVRGVIFADGDALPFGDPNQPQREMRGRWLLHTPPFTTVYRLVTHTGWLNQRIMRQVCGSQCDGFTPALAQAWMRPMQQGDAERSLFSTPGMLALPPAQVQAIRVPRAIIWGSEDASGGGSLTGAQQNLGQPPTRIIQHAGHLSMLAKPAEFADDVSQLAAGMR